MFRSFARALTLGVSAATAMLGAQAASATTYVFDLASANATQLNYYTPLNYGGSSLSMDVYGGHLNDAKSGSLNTVSTATAESWAGYGLGVLFSGSGDSVSNGTHQIDNVGGGVDFVALSFSQAVTLSDIGRTAYGMTGYGTDGDASFMAYSGSIGSLLGGVDETNFSSLDYGKTATTSTASSKIWLVAANVGLSDRDDGFKLTKLTVNTPNNPTGAVPEPASWAMMIVGFGAVGAGMRRRKNATMAAA